jgi:PDZ domain-containing secreted protein
VCKIKDNCPVKDEVHLEDRIIAVDDDDVQTMNAVKLSKLLVRWSGNAQQKITVLWRVMNDGGA